MEPVKKALDTEKRSWVDRYFIAIFGLLVAGAVLFTFYRMVIQKDYLIEAQSDCDPYTEACFVWSCDPESTVEGEACTGDPENDVSYYSLIRKKASDIPLCDPDTDDTCQPLECQPGEADCTRILCDDSNKDEQEAECNDPAAYTEENPPEEQSDETDDAQCSPDDETCQPSDADDSSEESDVAPSDDMAVPAEDGSSADDTVDSGSETSDVAAPVPAGTENSNQGAN